MSLDFAPWPVKKYSPLKNLVHMKLKK